MPAAACGVDTSFAAAASIKTGLSSCSDEFLLSESAPTPDHVRGGLSFENEPKASPGHWSQIFMRKPVIIDVVSTLVPVPAKPNLAPGVPGNAEASPFATLP